MHDAFRVYRNGHGTSEHVIRGMKILQKHGVDVSTISTITQANVNGARELYAFIRSLGITRIKFSHLHERERFGSLSSMAVSPKDYASFMIEIFRAWMEEDNLDIEVSELVSLIHILTGADQGECIFAGTCDQYLPVEHDGSIMWCDTIAVPDETPVFGNIRDGLRPIASSQPFRQFQANLKDLRSRAKSHQWYQFLSFGCIRDYRSLPFADPSAGNTYAEAWIEIASVIAAELKKQDFKIRRDPRNINSSR